MLNKNKIIDILLLILIFFCCLFNDIKASTNAAKIGDTEYETLEAAFSNAQEGDTITLLADNSENVAFQNQVTLNTNNFSYTGSVNGATASITKDNPIVITYYSTLYKATTSAESGDTVVLLIDLLNRNTTNEAKVVDKDITIDLNGHKIIGNYTNSGAILTYGNTSSKTSHLIITDNSDEKGGYIKNTNTTSAGNGIVQDGYSVLSLSHVTVEGAYAGIFLDSYYGAENQLIIGSGANVIGNSYAGIYTKYYYSDGSNLITINGGNVQGKNRGIFFNTSSASLIVNEGNVISTDIGVVISKKNCSITINDGTIVGTSQYGIQVGTIASSTGNSVAVNGGSIIGGTNGIYLNAKNNNVTIDGGMISGSANGVYVGGVTSGTENSVTVTGGTVKKTGDSDGSAIALWNGAKLTMTGGAVESVDGGFAIANNGSNTVATTIDISGGTVSAINNGTAIYQAGPSTTTISGEAVINGYDAGIEIRNGSLSISNGHIEAISSSFSCDANENGTTTSGAALAIAQHVTKKDINVNITGGVYKGIRPVNESNPQENDPAPQVALSVSGGDFWSTSTNLEQSVFVCDDCDKFVSAGYFSSFLSLNYIVPGYMCIDVTDNTEKEAHNNLGYKIGDIQTAVNNVIKANQVKENKNQNIDKTTLTINNGTGSGQGIEAEIDDTIIIVANTNAENSVTGVGYNIREEKDITKGTSTYSATALNVGEYVQNDEIKTDGAGTKDSKKITNVSAAKQGVTVSTGVLGSAGTVTDTADNYYLEKIVSDIVDSYDEMMKLKLNQATAAKAINSSNKDISGNDVNIKVTTSGSGIGEVASKTISIFIKTYYDTEVIDDSTAQAGKSFTYDIKPMYQAYASTANNINNIENVGETTVTIGDPKELMGLSGKIITLKFVLPEGFITSVDQKVYVIHTLSNGIKKYYDSTITKNNDDFIISFDNPDGFSSFTFTLNNPLTANSNYVYKIPKTGVE